MKTRIRRLSLVLLVITLFFTGIFSTNIFATNKNVIYDIQGIYNYSAGNSVARESDGIYYLGKVYYGESPYYFYRYYGAWYAIFGLDLSMPAYKGQHEMTVTQTISRTYSSQTTLEFSNSLGGTLAIPEVIELSRELTGSIAQTEGKDFSVEYAVSYTINADDPVGYYKIGLCHDINRHYVETYDTATASWVWYDFPTAVGTMYYALLYSTSSGSGYARR